MPHIYLHNSKHTYMYRYIGAQIQNIHIYTYIHKNKIPARMHSGMHVMIHRPFPMNVSHVNDRCIAVQQTWLLETPAHPILHTLHYRCTQHITTEWSLRRDGAPPHLPRHVLHSLPSPVTPSVRGVSREVRYATQPRTSPPGLPWFLPSLNSS